MGNRPMLTAHAGFDGTAAETLAGIRAAVNSGADCMEIDLCCQDGQVYIRHDPLEDYSGCVTLEEALDVIVPGTVRVNCDLKQREAFRLVLEAFRRRGIEDRLIFTGSYPLEEEEQGSCYQYFINIDQLVDLEVLPEDTALPDWYVEELIDWYRREKPERPALGGLNLNYWRINSGILAQFAAAKVPLSIWTADHMGIARYLWRKGIANMTSNVIAAFLRENPLV